MDCHSSASGCCSFFPATFLDSGSNSRLVCCNRERHFRTGPDCSGRNRSANNNGTWWRMCDLILFTLPPALFMWTPTILGRPTGQRRRRRRELTKINNFTEKSFHATSNFNLHILRFLASQEALSIISADVLIRLCARCKIHYIRNK